MIVRGGVAPWRRGDHTAGMAHAEEAASGGWRTTPTKGRGEARRGSGGRAGSGGRDARRRLAPGGGDERDVAKDSPASRVEVMNRYGSCARRSQRAGGSREGD